MAASLPSIVFVTAYDTYALEAFEVCAVDYLLIPSTRSGSRGPWRACGRATSPGAAERPAGRAREPPRATRARHTTRPERPRLLAESGGRMHLLDAAQVEAIEADRNYVVIRVGRERFHARSTLGQAEAALRAQPMLRISRSCLVNMNHVREVNRTLRGDYILVLAGGVTLTSSEGFRARVRDHLGTLRIAPG